jgi:hypothetical protein
MTLDVPSFDACAPYARLTASPTSRTTLAQSTTSTLLSAKPQESRAKFIHPQLQLPCFQQILKTLRLRSLQAASFQHLPHSCAFFTALSRKHPFFSSTYALLRQKHRGWGLHYVNSNRCLQLQLQHHRHSPHRSFFSCLSFRAASSFFSATSALIPQKAGVHPMTALGTATLTRSTCRPNYTCRFIGRGGCNGPRRNRSYSTWGAGDLRRSGSHTGKRTGCTSPRIQNPGRAD